MTAAGLKRWAETELVPKANKPLQERANSRRGESACRFCRAKATCKALAEYNLQLAQHDFAEPKLLGDADIVDILARADLFTSWIKAVNEYAYATAMGGKGVARYKLVEGAKQSACTPTRRPSPRHSPRRVLPKIRFTPRNLSASPPWRRNSASPISPPTYRRMSPKRRQAYPRTRDGQAPRHANSVKR